MLVRLLLALGLAIAAVPALAARPTVPKPYWGRWNPSAAACNKGEPLQEIRIGATGLDYWEWSHQPLHVATLGADSVRIRAWLYESDSNDPNKPSGKVTVVLRLLAGGELLSHQVDGEAPLFYVRCKGKRPEQAS
jgi:hypothetical protein